MARMRRLAALSCLGAALLASACASSTPKMPATCTDTSRTGYERALRAAPGDVRLPGGTPISMCLRRAVSDGELQELGTVVHAVAEDLAARVRSAHDVTAARRLGYLSGAVAAGAERSNGVTAELARRVAVAGAGVTELSPALAQALREGERAGTARG